MVGFSDAEPICDDGYGGELHPRIATAPAGVSVVTWHSDEPGEGYGADFDVIYAVGLESDVVPEPGFGLGLGAGVFGLLSASARKRRAGEASRSG